MAPSELLKLVYCGCTTSDCSKICNCRKAGMKCSRACKGCKGATYTNASDIVDNTDDGDKNEDGYDENGNWVRDDRWSAEYNLSSILKIIQPIYGSNSDTDSDERDKPEKTMVDEEEEIEKSGNQEEEGQ